MLRFVNNIRSVYGHKYRIYIYDRDFTGDPTEMNTYGEQITMEGDADDTFKRICPATATFTVLLNDNNYGVAQKAELVSFYNELIDSPEGRFYVTIWKPISFVTPQILFRGKIIADIGDLTLSYHRDLKITAICGLTDLKNKELKPPAATVSQPYPQLAPIALPNLIIEILKLSDVVKFFWYDTSIATQHLVTTSFNWTSDLGPWHEHELLYYWFEKIGTYYKYKDAYEVLRQIMEGFNARMISSGGIYHAEQLSYLDNATPIRRGYNSAGNTLPTDPKPATNITTNNDVYVLTDPSVRAAAPLSGVEYVNATEYNNYLETVTLDITNNPGPINFGTIKPNGNRLVMSLSFDFGTHDGSLTQWSQSGVGGFGSFILCEFTVKIGTAYLYVNQYYPNQGEPPVMVSNSSDGVTIGPSHIPGTLSPICVGSWSNTEKFVRFAINGSITPANYKNWAVIIESEAIPADGEMIIELTRFGVGNSLTGSLLFAPFNFDKWTWTTKSRIIVAPDYNGLTEPPEAYSLFDIVGATNKIQKIDFGFGGVYGWNTLYRLYQIPTEWTDPDESLTTDLYKLTMKTVLAMRATNSRIASIPITTKNGEILTGDHRFQINSYIFIPLKFEHDLFEDNYKITMWEIKKDFSGQIETTVIGDEPAPDFPTGLNLDPESPSANIEKYYYEQTGVTTDHVTIDNVLGYYITSATSVISIKENWTVIVDGVTQHYIDFNTLTFPLTPGDIQIGQYTVDIENDAFYFWGALDSQLVVIKYIGIK